MSSLPHKYRPGDVVGVVADCMADCEIVRRVRKQPGKALSYVARAVRIHHPKPKESFFGKHVQFLLEEKRITVLLTSSFWKPANLPRKSGSISKDSVPAGLAINVFVQRLEAIFDRRE